MIEGIQGTAASLLQPALITLSKKVSQYLKASLAHIACNLSNLVYTTLKVSVCLFVFPLHCDGETAEEYALTEVCIDSYSRELLRWCWLEVETTASCGRAVWAIWVRQHGSG